MSMPAVAEIIDAAALADPAFTLTETERRALQYWKDNARPGEGIGNINHLTRALDRAQRTLIAKPALSLTDAQVREIADAVGLGFGQVRYELRAAIEKALGVQGKVDDAASPDNVEVSDEQCALVYQAVCDDVEDDPSTDAHRTLAALQQFAAPLHARVKELDERYSKAMDRIRELGATIAANAIVREQLEGQLSREHSSALDMRDNYEKRIAELEAQRARSSAYIAELEAQLAPRPATAGVTYEECRAIYDAALEGDDEEGDLSPLRDALQKFFAQASAPLHARIAELEARLSDDYTLEARVKELKADHGINFTFDGVRAALAAAGVPGHEDAEHWRKGFDRKTNECCELKEKIWELEAQKSALGAACAKSTQTDLAHDADSEWKKRALAAEAQLAQRPAAVGVTEPSKTRAVELVIGFVEKWLDRKSAETAVLLSNLRRDFGLIAPAPEPPVKCDYGDERPGHTDPEERPCGYEAEQPTTEWNERDYDAAGEAVADLADPDGEGPSFGEIARAALDAVAYRLKPEQPADKSETHVSINGGGPMTWREYSDHLRESFLRLRDSDLREIKALIKRCHKAEARLKPEQPADGRVLVEPLSAEEREQAAIVAATWPGAQRVTLSGAPLRAIHAILARFAPATPAPETVAEVLAEMRTERDPFTFGKYLDRLEAARKNEVKS